ncbi:MAG: orotate phosphoribosyltransferase [Deltaproteobacteria bacterium]|nr:orotate phosphoribosyltransferase [Deltaproteobacteria bacterium]
MSDGRQRLLEILRSLSYEKREVTLTSGKKSSYYIDGKQTTLDPEGAFLVGGLFTDIIRKEFGSARGVGGITLGADPIISAVMVVGYTKGLRLKGFIVRKEPKGHGTGAWIEGLKGLRAGDEVVIVEDVVTTGGSAIKAAEKAQDAGLRVPGVLAIVDRLEGGREHIESKGYRLFSLFTKRDLGEQD